MLGFGGLYLVLFGIVFRASRKLERQTREIIRSEDRFRSLVASAMDGIVASDAAGRIVLFNHAAETIFGYSAAEIAGRPLSTLIPQSSRARHEAGLREYFASGGSPRLGKVTERTGRHSQGRIFPLELSISGSGSSGEQIVTAIVRDISERKIMQQQLIQGERQSTIALMAGSISHELNNAITSLVGYADLLRERPDDPQLSAKCAEVFQAQSHRLKHHAHNLLALSKPRPPQMKSIRLNDLLDKVTEMLVISGVLKYFELRKEFAPGLPPVIGDELLLEQVIQNLEINAAHAMGSRGTLTVRTGRSAGDGRVEFAILDTGCGIPPENLEQVFLPFFTTKAEGKGTGLGMYIVKQIVTQHQGRIQLNSRVRAGTEIIIQLPAAPQGEALDTEALAVIASGKETPDV